MSPILNELERELPCRINQIERLYNLFAYKDEPYPSSVYIYGGPSVGKSIVVTSLLKKLHIKHAVVNLIECYTQKILFESILNKLAGHKIDPNVGQPYARCDNFMEFIDQLRKCSERLDLNHSVVVLDKAEQLRKMEHNLLIGFLRLQEFTNLSISVILLSDLVYSNYFGRDSMRQPIKVHFPQYNKDELLEILSLEYENAKTLCPDFEFDIDFFRGFLDPFLSVFYNTCRDLGELRRMARINFLHYCEPVIRKECKMSNSLILWKHILPTLKASLSMLYLRTPVDYKSDTDGLTKIDAAYADNTTLARSLELPFYAKYLLIAAYLASYNPAKEDKRLFMKYHGKKRTTKSEMRQKAKSSIELNTQLGPKAFTLDRLLAIFYAILDDKVGFNNNLLVQVSSLVQLQLLIACSDTYSLDSQKYKCNVDYDFIQVFGKMVGFNIRKYLVDFN